MNLLTILGRESRSLSRKGSTFALRMIFMGVATATWALTNAGSSDPRFHLIGTAGVSLIFFGFASAFSLADAISFERRNGTLGLLLLTPLRTWEILLGKLITCVTQFLLCLLAILPILALPVLIGEVTWQDVARAFLAILAASLLGMFIGLFASVISVQFVQSFGIALALLIFFHFGFPFLIFLPRPILGLRDVEEFWMAPLWLVFPVPHEIAIEQWLLNLFLVLGSGLVFLLLAQMLFGLIWKGMRRGRPSEVLRAREQYSPARKFSFSQPAVWQHPRLPGWLYRGCAVFLWITTCVWTLVAGDTFYENSVLLAGLTGWLLLLLIYWQTIQEALEPLQGLRESGMLELMLASLLPARSLIAEMSPRPDGTRPWNRKLLKSFFYTQMAGGLYMMGQQTRMNLDHVLLYPPTSLPLLLLIIIPLDLVSIRAGALWYGMKGIRPIRNVLSLLVFHLVVPYLILLFLLLAGGWSNELLIPWAVLKVVLSSFFLWWWRSRTRQVMLRRLLPERHLTRHR